LTINSNALVDDGIKNAKPFEKFQFERVGFFSVDPDSTNDHVRSSILRSLKSIPFVFFVSTYSIEQLP
jgi:glutaminyl-tRNA synthetase